MSWLLTAFGAWQHSHPFISAQLGHLPISLPFQTLLTQNETNTNKESSLWPPRNKSLLPGTCSIPLLIPPKIGRGFYLSIFLFRGDGLKVMSLLRVSRWMKFLAALPETLFLFLQDTAGAKLLIYNCAANLSPRTYVLVLSRERTAVKTLRSANSPQKIYGCSSSMR